MRRLSLVIAALLLPAAASAQLPERPVSAANGRLLAGAEISASLSRSDEATFFNYTDYDNDALRMARLRLMGEWRPQARFSVLGEVRAVSGAHVELSALFARWQPSSRVNFDIQAGRIPPVIGAFARRAYGRDNPLVGMPLAYQYLMSLRPDALPATTDDLFRMRGRGWQPSFPLGSTTLTPGLPMVSALRWDTGVEAHWAGSWLDLAGAVTEGSPAHPVVRDHNDGREWSGRAAVVLPAGLTVGISGARGAWIDRDVLNVLPSPSTAQNGQTLAGADADFSRGHWIIRGEWLRSTFTVPTLASTPLAASAEFVETRYRFSPRWQIATRVDHMSFSNITGLLFQGVPTPWDAPVSRVEATAGLRLRPTLELRGGLQANWRHLVGRTRSRVLPTAQLLYWF